MNTDEARQIMDDVMGQVVKHPLSSQERGLLAFQAFENFLKIGQRFYAFEARLLEAESRVFSGDDELARAALDWCLTEYQKSELTGLDTFYQNQVRLEFLIRVVKQVTSQLYKDIRIPREHIEKQLEFFKQLLQKHGKSEVAYHQQVRRSQYYFGELEHALEPIPVDVCQAESIEDCQQCSVEQKARVLFDFGRVHDYFNCFIGVKNDTTGCPGIMLYPCWAEAALAFLKRNAEGDREKAVEYASTAMTKTQNLSPNPFIKLRADCMAVMAKTGNNESALTCFNSYCDLAYAGCDTIGLLRWLEASVVLLSHSSSPTLVLEATAPSWVREDKIYQVNKLKKIVDQEARTLAQKLDTRNGNTYYSDGYNYYDRF